MSAVAAAMSSRQPEPAPSLTSTGDNVGNGQPFTRLRRFLLTTLLLAGTVACLVTWWIEASAGLISHYDQYGNPFLVISLLLGLFARVTQPRYRPIFEAACYFGISLYFVGSLSFLVVLHEKYSIYNISNTLQWIPLIYIASFVFFESRQAVAAGCAVFVASLILPISITVVKGMDFWSTPVLSLLLNSYCIQILTLLASAFIAFLQEQYQAATIFGREMKERVHEREKALAALKKETAERLRLEDQLRQAQKMEAVGQLTGGIAHDFNNLLVVILGNAEILAAKIPDPLLRSLAADIEAAADRSAELTSRLLAFARRQTLRPEPLDLGDIVQGLAGMLRRTIGEQIALRTDLAPVPLRTMADRALLEASILNLVVNARDAMPDGGTLTIGTGDVVISTDQYIRLSVCDTGTGMPPEVQARVFEPFFTTKETGRGSGLGLSMVHGFIKQSEGHVAIESAPGCGTTVTLLLPALPAESPDVPRASAEKAVQHARAKETILVVEDEAEVRRFVTAQLSSLGYEVVEAEDGPRALERLRAGGNVALLFTDVVLPGGMTGPQLAEAARRLRPGLRVLFTSGYPEETFARHGGLSVNVRLLRKPYRKADLAKAVSAAIDAGA